MSFCQVLKALPYLSMMFLCGKSYKFFASLIDAFLEALLRIDGIKIRKEFGEFLTGALLEMIAFSRVFQAIDIKPLPWLLILFMSFGSNTNGQGRIYQMMIHSAVICAGYNSGDMDAVMVLGAHSDLVQWCSNFWCKRPDEWCTFPTSSFPSILLAHRNEMSVELIVPFSVYTTNVI